MILSKLCLGAARVSFSVVCYDLSMELNRVLLWYQRIGGGTNSVLERIITEGSGEWPPKDHEGLCSIFGIESACKYFLFATSFQLKKWGGGGFCPGKNFVSED